MSGVLIFLTFGGVIIFIMGLMRDDFLGDFIVFFKICLSTDVCVCGLAPKILLTCFDLLSIL